MYIKVKISNIIQNTFLPPYKILQITSHLYGQKKILRTNPGMLCKNGKIGPACDFSRGTRSVDSLYIEQRQIAEILTSSVE